MNWIKGKPGIPAWKMWILEFPEEITPPNCDPMIRPAMAYLTQINEDKINHLPLLPH